VECGDKTDETKTGIERYLYPHNKLYISPKATEEILSSLDEYKFGKDI